MEELISAFTLERVGKAGAKFDPDKTKWFQQQYLKHTSDEELARLLKAEFNLTQDDNTLIAFCKLMKERAVFVKDMMTEGAYLFNAPTSYDEQTVSKKWKEDSPALMTEWKSKLEAISEFTSENVETEFKAFLEAKGLGIGAVLPLFRLLITGMGTGPSMFEISAFLGKAETLTRMEKGLAALS